MFFSTQIVITRDVSTVAELTAVVNRKCDLTQLNYAGIASALKTRTKPDRVSRDLSKQLSKLIMDAGNTIQIYIYIYLRHRKNR